MIDWKDLLPKQSSIAVWIIILIIYCFVGCTIYPTNLTFGGDSCPRICGVDHKHRSHSIDYNCGQKTCIHMLKK